MDAANVDELGTVTTWLSNPVVGTPDVDQPDSSRRALFNASDASFNGEPSATFSGTDAASAKYYDTAALNGLTQGEVFAVMKCDYTFGSYPSGAYTGLWVMDTHGATDHYMWTDGVIYDGFGSTARKAYGDMSALPLNTPHVYNVSSTAGAYTARFNGTTVFSTATNTAGFPTSARFGRSGGGTLAIFNGRLAYLVVCSQVQTPTARAKMNRYLAHRFGIAVA